MYPYPQPVSLIFALCFVWMQGVSQEPDTTGHGQETRNNKLEKELFISTIDSMARAAEFWHSLQIKASSGKLDTLDEETVEREVRSTDSSNLVALKTLFTLYGFPGIREYGRKASRDYTYLLHRSGKDPKFQEKVLQAMKALVEAQNASAQDYAYLTDLVRLNTGRKQLYGTQVALNNKGSGLMLKPVEAPELLDERRNEIGLGPVEAYLDKMNERYGFN